ncbi:CDP-glucose 4,6-dehydratase [soil metagenome]
MGEEAVTPDFLKYYAGKRVFLTGHTGFKGAWLSLWLKQLGADVTGYALASSRDGLFATGRIAEGMTSIEGDVRDRRELAAALRKSDPEIIIHMAAQSLVRPSYDDPVGTMSTNVIGTANLLDSARALERLASIVVVTSDKCYENDGAEHAFSETSAMGGADPYSASKGCTEIVASSFARSFYAETQCTVATARAGNVIGGGDWSVDRIIPDLMRTTQTLEPVVVRRPDSVRPWQHVLEPLRGYLMLAHRGATEGDAFSGGWNFGPHYDDAVPVRLVVEGVRKLWPRVAASFATHIEGPHEAAMLRLDCSKADERLDWRSVLNLDSGLEMTVAWYRETFGAPETGARIASRQIAEYQNLLSN